MTAAVDLAPDDTRADRRTIFRGAGLAMAGFLVRPLARLPFLIIVGRIYGTEAFGRSVFAIGVFEALAAFCRLGLKDNLFRFLAQRPDAHREVLAEALLAGGGLAALVAVAVAVAAPMIGAALHTAPLWRMLAFLIPVLPVFVATDLLFAAVRFHRIVGYEVVGRSIVEPLTITAGALAFGLAGFGARGLLIAYMIAQGLTLAVAATGVVRRFSWSTRPGPLDWARARAMVARSLPTGVADCVGLGFNTVGIFLTGNLLGDAALGVYGMALNLETGLSKVRQAFDMIVVPVVSRGLAERGENYVVDQLRMITRSLLSAQLPLLAIVALFGADILGLFGRGFRTGAVLLGLMALAAVIDGAVNLAQVPLFMSRPKTNLAIAVGALAVNLGLGLWLIPRIGVAGGGVALAAALAAAGLARQLFVRRVFGRSLLTPALWRPVAATLGAAATAMAMLRLLPNQPLARGVAAAGLVVSYFGLLALVDGGMRRDAVAWVKGRF